MVGLNPNSNLPIDENVKIPRGVTKASENADAIHKAAYNTETEAPPPEAPPAAAATPPATPPAQPPQAAPATPPAAPSVPQETADDWKHRYNSLQGRFNAQSTQIANQNARLASLESMLATLNKPAPAATPPVSAKKLVTDAEETEYGKDFLDVVRRAAREAAEPVIEERVSTVRREVSGELSRVKTQAAQIEQQTTQNAKATLLSFLDDSLSNWRDVNKHPRFLNWLTLTDPLSGATRRTLLNDAYDRNDAVRVLSFYRAFLTEEGHPPPNGGQPGNGAAPAAPKVPLASLAAPGKPSASAAPPMTPPGGKPIITRAQISTFYANKRKGMYSAKEVVELEAELQLAINEGRISN